MLTSASILSIPPSGYIKNPFLMAVGDCFHRDGIAYEVVHVAHLVEQGQARAFFHVEAPDGKVRCDLQWKPGDLAHRANPCH